MPTLNIIGAGRVARVLGRLWADRGPFELQQILNRSVASGQVAAVFMGGGEAVSGFDRLRPADAWMIGTPDDAVARTAQRLSNCVAVAPKQIAFHLSGALTSSTLQPLADQGLAIGSLHPLKTIPDAQRAYHGFDQTWCALEGNETACSRLEKALATIGARSFRLRAEQKLLYHAGNAVVCNFLIALLDIGEAIYREAGIPASQAREMVAPLMHETLANGLELGAGQALTGPIVRGDAQVVKAHLEAIPPDLRAVYRELALHTVRLAQGAGRLESEGAERVVAALQGNKRS